MTVEVNKTYKFYIGGEFPRSESGRVYAPDGAPQRNVCAASRKDLRDAVAHARAALPKWNALTPYLRGQILYRAAEMLQSRAAAMVDELRACCDLTAVAARREVEAAVDLCTWYAGIPDKLQQLLGTNNDVSGPFFNFSTVEPTGVIGVGTLLPPQRQPALLGTLAVLLPLLAAGNTVVQMVSEQAPLPGLAFGEVLASSDLPAGVANLLAGDARAGLVELAAHRDVDGMLIGGEPDVAISALAADSVKRVRYAAFPAATFQRRERYAQLAMLEPFVEVKTFWHPMAE